MRKTLTAIILTFLACAAFADAQTKRKIVRRTATKTTVVKKTTAAPIKKMTSITTASGLTYIITQEGTGAPLKTGDNIVVNYTGLLTDGRKFDSSFDSGEPITFPLGAAKVIKGWDEAFLKLRVGSRATLITPPSIAYGARGIGGVIPPDATLIFVVEVVGVQ